MKEVLKAVIGADHLSPQEKTLFGKMLFTYGWRLSAFAFALWAVGTFSKFGLGHGFAFAEDFKNQQASIKNVELRLVEQDLMDTQKQNCAAPNAYFRQRINDLQREYSKKNGGGSLMLPTCRELGIDSDG